MSEKPLTPIEIGLTAAIVAIEGNEPRILVAAAAATTARPPLCRSARSIRSRTARSRSGSRAWVEDQTGLPSAMSSSSTRSAIAAATRSRAIPARTWSRSAISRSPGRDNAAPRRARASSRGTASSRGRTGARRGPRFSTRRSCPLLCAGPGGPSAELGRALGRASACGSASATTALRGTRRTCSTATNCSTKPGWSRRRGATAAPRRWRAPRARLGEPMRFDHRRILATAIARLRAKLKYRPVIFELMPGDSPSPNCSGRSRRSRAAICTSRISAGWSRPAPWSNRPATRRTDRRTARRALSLPPRGAAGAPGARPSLRRAALKIF